MRALLDVTPSAEQLSLFSRVNGGVEVIRGAAGSGKTTTALLKLRSSIGSFLNRRRRQSSKEPVRILVLTYNRTLSGYVSELAQKQFGNEAGIELTVSTFAKWAMMALGNPRMISPSAQSAFLGTCDHGLQHEREFIEEEVEYLTGRYLPEELGQYTTSRRDGRGGSPRMERAARETLLQQVVLPYLDFKANANLLDWNDLALELVRTKCYSYDIVVVDETQDFSANQIRAVMNQVADIHAVSFVLDTAQRIYARGFTWNEVGITIRPENSFRLQKNYRNTKEIAALAGSLVASLKHDDDGTMPNLLGAQRSGSKPLMLTGNYKNQVEFCISYIQNCVNISSESVAFLHPKGYGWFDYLRGRLLAENLPFVELAREAEWPEGNENIALCTFHSSKGLEFDHVIAIGLNSEVLTHGEEEDDDKLATLRRLLAMGIGRAKNSVILGYKPTEKSTVIDFIGSDTFSLVSV